MSSEIIQSVAYVNCNEALDSIYVWKLEPESRILKTK
jgi:hypothetical protein